MKQVFQDVAHGGTLLREVPLPRCRAGHVLVRTRRTLISAGTERSLVEFGRAGLIDKVRQQPDKVRMVIDKARTDGIASTAEAVRAKLNQPLPMGYSNVGIVEQVGAGVSDLAVGDRVLSNGNHAEFVCVPRNLCAKVPDDVSDDEAAFGVVGAIALQGLRLTDPTLGETFAVTGLGLIGLLTVQLLRANGCHVIGIDFDPAKFELAERFGAQTVRLDRGEDPVAVATRLTSGHGVDGVIITASAKGDDVVHQAATMCRKRGRIVLVGVVGLGLRRSDFYEKELTFQVSCSYGPGRYDADYEGGGLDYPRAFVRWTENRNFGAVLEQMRTGAIQTAPLVSAHYPIGRAPDAYDLLMSDRGALGVVLEFENGAEPDGPGTETTIQLGRPPAGRSGHEPVIGAIGAGNYAGRVLLPAFAKAGARLKGVVSSGGTSGDHVARTLSFEFNSTDVARVLEDPEITTVVIGTRHDSHASLAVAALDAGKHVFVEKPLALTHEELTDLEDAYRRASQSFGAQLMVGFNRRFAPLVVDLKRRADRLDGPGALVYTCNAGAIPSDSWVHDREIGGGRLVGEACHFFDLARHVAGAPVRRWEVSRMRGTPEMDLYDTASVSLEFEDGSLGVVHYFANGHRSFPKERIELFKAGTVLTLDNFRRLDWRGVRSGRSRSWRQDKGQIGCVQAFLRAVAGQSGAAIAPEEIFEVARMAIEVEGAARELD